MSSTLLSVSGLTVQYGDVYILDGAEMRVDRGETVAVIGPSGSGKTTLLHIIAGLTKGQKGVVDLFELRLEQQASTLPLSSLNQIYRNKLGFVYQQAHLIPMLSCLENLIVPLLLQNYDTSKARALSREKLAELELEHLAGQRASTLSGGERQRVAMARALMGNPQLLIMDEPTGSLDVQTADTIGEWLLAQAAAANATVIVATHDVNLASKMDKTYSLKAGQLSLN